MVLEVSNRGKWLPSVFEIRILGDNDKDPKDESTQMFGSVMLLLNQGGIIVYILNIYIDVGNI